MAKKSSNKVSIRKLEDAVKGTLNQTSILEWNGLEIEVKRNIGLDEACAFVDFLANACFANDAEYLPEAKDPAFRALIIKLFTNISLPSNAEKQYAILMHTDLVPRVISCIDEAQIESIVRAADEKIVYLCQSNINLVKKQMVDTSKSVEELLGQLSSVFEGVSQEDIANLTKAMANGGLDEQKLMQAYMDQKYKDEE